MATVSSVPGLVGGSEVDEINRSVALGRSQMLCNWPTLWQRKSQVLKSLFKGTREPTSKAARSREPERRSAEGRPNLALVPASSVPSVPLEWLRAMPPGLTLTSRTGWV